MNTDREPESGSPGEPASSAPSAVRPARRVTLLALVAVAVYVVDLITKIVATSGLEGAAPVRILGGVVYLQLVRNPYAAFGMDFGGTWLLALVAIVVVAVIAWFARRLRSTGWAIGLGLVLAGALGNLTDRLFRAPGPMQGHVVDFVSVFGPDGRYFPVFNAADSAITIGAILIVVLSLLGRDYDGTITRGPKKNADESTADSAEPPKTEPPKTEPPKTDETRTDGTDPNAATGKGDQA